MERSLHAANLRESYTSNSSGNSSSVFIADLPMVINYNYGNAATRKAPQRWGFSLAAAIAPACPTMAG